MKRVTAVLLGLLLSMMAFSEVVTIGDTSYRVGDTSYTMTISVDLDSGRKWMDVTNGIQAYLIDANEGTNEDKTAFILYHLDRLDDMDEDYEVEEYFIKGSTISMTKMPTYKYTEPEMEEIDPRALIILGSFIESMGSILSDNYIGSAFD